ncbi:restriction endonuclease [Microbulbifer epialgicus]|uniref:Restriction endonuclease n=1 Tax=Microbulbifer epialgicus TaxID=393907 RepID=A0ABV4NTF3_9GAMM
MEQLLALLASYDVLFLGHSVPLYVVLAAALFAFVFLGSYPLKRRKPWRIAASKKWLRQFRANKDKYTPVQRFTYIRKVDHFLWEEILMSCFEERGYPIIRTKMTRDGGSDGFVTINDDFVVIQAKRYKGRISKAHVVELDRLVNHNRRHDKGLFIHTGKTSTPIMEFFRSNDHMEILSGVDRILSFLDGEELSLFGNRLNKPKAMR